MKQPGAIIIEGHVQGLSNTRSLGEAGIPVLVVDIANCIARYSKYCSKFFICPDYRSNAFIDFLINLSQSENLRNWVLIPSNDHIVYALSKNKDRLSKHYKLITADINIIETIYDKLRLIQIAQQANVPHPLTFTFQDFTHQVYPVLIKGRNGLTFYKTFGKKVFKATNKSEYLKCIESIKASYSTDGVFVQELISNTKKNKTISFTAFAVDGIIKTYWMGLKIREHPVEFGTGTFAVSLFNNDCLDQSITLLKELNYTGVCEIEYLLDPKDNKYKLIEINARTWLWVELAKACGIDYAKYIYQYINHIPSVFPESYPTGVKWINIWTDIPYSVIALLQGKLTFKDYLHVFKGGKLHIAMLKWSDIKPFIMYAIFLFKFFKTRRYVQENLD